MHREISHAEQPFYQERNIALYLMTALIGLLIAADLWPAAAVWLGVKEWAPWPREFYGTYRFALLAAVIGGARILYGSIESLLEGKLGADLALAIATIAAILIGEPLVAAEVVFIGMVGECLESFTFERTQRAIRGIVEVCPRRCWLLRNGEEVRVLTSEVQVGDRVVVKPGARIPVDGVVIDGRSAVDQSALTGESLPLEKQPGDEVLAGSLNQHGALTVEAKRVAEHTVVGRVIELTGKALQDKATLERTADRLARLFLPAVLGLAAITFFVCMMVFWGPLASAARRLDFAAAVRMSVYPMLAVLVVACPCALILATPAAIIAALGRLAGTGVLIKGGSALERLAQVKAIAFDKTGTLTEGRLELGDVIGFRGISRDELLRVAATAEQKSEHPLSKVILSAVQPPFDPLVDFVAHPGAGVSARTVGTPGMAITVGTRRLLDEKKIAIPAPATTLLEKLDAAGQTALLVALEDVVIGIIGARDTIRPEAADVITELRNLGIEHIALLTGDRAGAARAVAEHVGIKEVHAELLPHQKAEIVGSGQWAVVSGTAGSGQSAGGTKAAGVETAIVPSIPSDPSSLATGHWPLATAFVGDGINDAPALARATVGLAIGGTGTDVAAEAGDIIFMGQPLRPMPLLIRLSRETVRIIRQNILIFAFIVNGIGIVLTAWLWPLLLPADWYEQAPLAGVIYHQLGSLLVLLNSMRLLWFDKPRHPAFNRMRDAVSRADAWMEHYLNLDEALHWLSHHVKKAGLVVGSLVLFVWLVSGFTVVSADELAVVRRFGSPLSEPLEPGLHWIFPWPVDSLLRVQPDRVRIVEIGFRSAVGKPIPAGSLGGDWSSAHRGEGISRREEEAVMITGDGNLVELQATVRYTVSRPHLYTFLFEVRDPDDTIRAAAESVLREAVAAQPFLDLLTINRERFQQDVLARLRKRWESPEYGPAGLGVRLDGLSLHDLHPPQDPQRIVDAFHDVARAMERRDRRVNQAEKTRIEIISKAVQEEMNTVREAEAAAEEKVRMAEAARDGFLARNQLRHELSWQDEWQLLSEATAAMKAGQDSGNVYEEYQRRRRTLLAVQAYLTDFRLSLRSLSGALQKRDKVIVDADKVPGKRHLLLFDPELMRPAPIIIPAERQPPARSPFRPQDGP